jgi:hypothetical protein
MKHLFHSLMLFSFTTEGEAPTEAFVSEPVLENASTPDISSEAAQGRVR